MSADRKEGFSVRSCDLTCLQGFQCLLDYSGDTKLSRNNLRDV